MIHYHGTPMSGTRQDAANFLTRRHALVPYKRQDDMPIVADVCQSFILDNSAFSIWKRGGSMELDKYLAFVEKWQYHPGFDWALIPDMIEGNERQNDEYLRQWDTKAKGVPVYHLHESFTRLKRLINKYEIVAIGGSPQYPNLKAKAWWNRVAEIFNFICDEEGRPPCKLHGLRIMSPKFFTRLPLSSADSTNAARNCNKLERFGMYPPPTAAQRAASIANKIEAFNSAPVWQEATQLSISFGKELELY